MYRKNAFLVGLLAGIAVAILAGGVAWAQEDGGECYPLWSQYGCCPPSHEAEYVPDYARQCQEQWREDAWLDEALACDEESFDEEDVERALAAEPPADHVVTDVYGTEDTDYWYDGETNQYHRYALAKEEAELNRRPVLTEAELDDLFDLGDLRAVELAKPSAASADAMPAEPMLGGQPEQQVEASPEVLLRAARLLDRISLVLQNLSQHLTGLAEQEMVEASASAYGTLQR